MASSYGFHLRWWRYGAGSERLIQEILHRDTWTSNEWKNWQEKRLKYILNRAATRVPYYRDYWRDRRDGGAKANWEVLENWPILEKEDIRANPEAFIADDCRKSRMFRDHTSGTTGTPLTIYQTRATVQMWYAMYEARLRRWHDVSIKEKWIILGGQMVSRLEKTDPPFWVRNYGLNQLYLSTSHISKNTARDYVNIINKFNPTHWIVYPSSGTHLAQLILDQKLEVNSPKTIFSNAEPLSSEQREIISTAFACPVRNTYGMGEIVLGASECKEGNMHYWPDSGILEIMQEDANQKDTNASGQFIATGLVNPDMPLIRYRIGDRGRIAKARECSCERTLPRIHEIEGRDSDLILTRDGRKIFWLNPIFDGKPIREAQIIQDSLEKIRIKLVTVNGFGPTDEADIIQRTRNRLGSTVAVEIIQVETIPRTKSGKFKPVVSHLD